MPDMQIARCIARERSNLFTGTLGKVRMIARLQWSLAQLLVVSTVFGVLLACVVQSCEHRMEFLALRQRTAYFNSHYFEVGWSNDHKHIIELFAQPGMVQDSDLVVLRLTPQLRTLSLSHSQVTDAGLQAISACPQLEFVDLSNTGISDASLSAFSALANLKSLSLLDTHITVHGVEALVAAHPSLQVQHYEQKVSVP